LRVKRIAGEELIASVENQRDVCSFVLHFAQVPAVSLALVDNFSHFCLKPLRAWEISNQKLVLAINVVVFLNACFIHLLFLNKIFRVFILFFCRSCFAESAMELTATQVAPKFRQWLRLLFARKLPIYGLTEFVSCKLLAFYSKERDRRRISTYYSSFAAQCA